MSYELEPAIWSHDMGPQIPCIDRCQLIIPWMSNIKEVHGKHRLHVSVMTYYWEYDRHVVRLRRHCCRCAYVPTSNAASHDKHEKINSWVFFSFLYEYGALLGSPLGCQSSAINTYAPYFSFTIKSVTIEKKKNLILK